MTQSEMWQSCRDKAKIGKDVNSGGLGRIKIGNTVYVGGFFMNLIMLYRPEESLLRFSSNPRYYPTESLELTPEEFSTYINR